MRIRIRNLAPPAIAIIASASIFSAGCGLADDPVEGGAELTGNAPGERFYSLGNMKRVGGLPLYAQEIRRTRWQGDSPHHLWQYLLDKGKRIATVDPRNGMIEFDKAAESLGDPALCMPDASFYTRAEHPGYPDHFSELPIRLQECVATILCVNEKNLGDAGFRAGDRAIPGALKFALSDAAADNDPGRRKYVYYAATLNQKTTSSKNAECWHPILLRELEKGSDFVSPLGFWAIAEGDGDAIKGRRSGYDYNSGLAKAREWTRSSPFTSVFENR